MGENWNEIKGRTKEAAGDLTDDDSLKAEGKVDQATGTLQDKAEDAADWTKDKIRDAD